MAFILVVLDVKIINNMLHIRVFQICPFATKILVSSSTHPYRVYINQIQNMFVLAQV